MAFWKAFSVRGSLSATPWRNPKLTAVEKSDSQKYANLQPVVKFYVLHSFAVSVPLIWDFLVLVPIWHSGNHRFSNFNLIFY